MLKTTGSSGLAAKELGTDEVVRSGGRADETVVDSSKSSKKKVKELSKVEKPQRPEKSAEAIGLEKPNFLGSDTKLAFIKIGSSYTKLTMRNYWLLLEAFQKWSCKHEVLMLTYYCSLRQFKDTKSSSSRQLCWTQELSRYHFWTDYQPGSLRQPASLTLFRA